MNEKREIVVKTNLTPSTFVEFRDECAKDEVSQSGQVNRLIKGWLKERRNRSGAPTPGGRPCVGPKRAYCPGKANFGVHAFQARRN